MPNMIFVIKAWSCEKWEPISWPMGHFDPPPASFRVKTIYTSNCHFFIGFAINCTAYNKVGTFWKNHKIGKKSSTYNSTLNTILSGIFFFQILYYQNVPTLMKFFSSLFFWMIQIYKKCFCLRKQSLNFKINPFIH